MSDNATEFPDLMGKEGPCFHCRIDYTPLWRSGPPEKPVLCNACGSRWKAKGTLDDYVPKHGIKDIQSSQSDGTNTGNASRITLEAPMHAQNNEANMAPLWAVDNVSRSKRSKLGQHVLSPLELLHQQLYYAQQGSELAKQTDDDEDNGEDVLIFERINRYIPENEIGLGCMLLKPPSPAKDSKQDSTAESKLKESEPESSVGVQPLVSLPNKSKAETPQAFQLPYTTTPKALKPQTLPGKTGGSSSVEDPMDESSQ